MEFGSRNAEVGKRETDRDWNSEAGKGKRTAKIDKRQALCAMRCAERQGLNHGRYC